MAKANKTLQSKAIALRDRVIRFAREIEAKFGKDDDRTIFARNAYCELHEVANMLNEASGPLIWCPFCKKPHVGGDTCMGHHP
jgi:hypothetical protein